MQGLWMTCALTVGALLEVLLGSYGVLLPLTALVAFYFFVLKCWRQALLLSWIIGTLVDLAYGRSFPYYLLLIPLVLGTARLWREYQMTHLYAAQFIPGLLIGFLTGVFASVVSCLSIADDMPLPWLSCIWLTLKCMGVTAVATPLLVWLLECCSKLLGLRRFTRIGMEALFGSRAEENEEVADAVP